MLSSEWLDAHDALAMGLAWRVASDAELPGGAEEAAATIAALDPTAVAATKRLLIAGRADMARAAMDRELTELATLVDRTIDEGDGSLD